MRTYETFLKAFSVAFTVIVLKIIDKNIYDMSIWVGAILAVCLLTISFKVIEKIPSFKKDINKKMNIVLTFATLTSIIGAFYLFGL